MSCPKSDCATVEQDLEHNGHGPVRFSRGLDWVPLLACSYTNRSSWPSWQAAQPGKLFYHVALISSYDDGGLGCSVLYSNHSVIICPPSVYVHLQVSMCRKFMHVMDAECGQHDNTALGQGWSRQKLNHQFVVW